MWRVHSACSVERVCTGSSLRAPHTFELPGWKQGLPPGNVSRQALRDVFREMISRLGVLFDFFFLTKLSNQSKLAFRKWRSHCRTRIILLSSKCHIPVHWNCDSMKDCHNRNRARERSISSARDAKVWRGNLFINCLSNVSWAHEE